MNEFTLPKTYNWQTASEPIVKKYIADLYQTGVTAPVATELFNNTGVAFTYEYVAPGVYAVTASGQLFTGPTAQKVQVSMSNATYIDDVAVPDGFSILAFPFIFNVIFIVTTDLTVAADAILGNNAQNVLEVTIYP
jgi:hypothetical protein